MKDLAHLIAGCVLALAGCVLVAIHTPVPAYVPFAALTLIGVAGGLAVAPAQSNDPPADPTAVPVAQLAATPPAKVQVASAPSTPPAAVSVAQRPAQPPAPAA